MVDRDVAAVQPVAANRLPIDVARVERDQCGTEAIHLCDRSGSVHAAGSEVDVHQDRITARICVEKSDCVFTVARFSNLVPLMSKHPDGIHPNASLLLYHECFHNPARPVGRNGRCKRVI